MKMRDDIALWGYSLQEYQDMFAITAEDLTKNILEYSSGPSSFNVDSSATITSYDKLFLLPNSDIEDVVLQGFHDMTNISQEHDIDYDELIAKRKLGIKKFLQDYPKGLKAGRYIHEISAFYDLALSAYYFFLDINCNHLEELVKLMEHVSEIRVYPIGHLGKISPLVAPLLLELQNSGFGVEIRHVNYPKPESGNAMLRVWKTRCNVI
jgi:hypothetical protein